MNLGLYCNVPEPAILCIKCGFALKADGDRVSRHLGEKHDVAKSARRGLNSLIRSLNLPDPNGLSLRPGDSSPHPHLAIQKGSACKHCGLRSVSEKVLVTHLKTSHSSEIKLAGRQKRHWLRDHIEERLTFQSWTAKDVQKLWLVISDQQPSQGSSSNNLLLQETPNPVKDLPQQLFTEERERLEKQSGVGRPFDGGMPTLSTLLTNWMRRTGWQNIFSGARRDVLVTLTELPCTSGRPFWLGVHDGEVLHSPARDECRLASIMAALDRLFDQCGETVRCTDVCVRRWLRGRFPERPYKAPFELVIRPTSERQYRKELKRCLCLWLRLLRLPPSTARSIMGRGLSISQRKALKQLWSNPTWEEERSTDPNETDLSYDDNGVEEYEDVDEVEDEDEDEYSDEGGGEGDDTEDYIGDNDPPGTEAFTAWSPASQDGGPNDPTADVVLRFCYHMVTEDLEDGRASSSLLIYFSAVRGLSRPSEDEYLRPHRFTPILAGLIYCARLFFS